MTKSRGPGRPPKNDAIRRENSVQVALSDASEERFETVRAWMTTDPEKPLGRSEVGRMFIEAGLDEITSKAAALRFLKSRGK